MATRCCTALLAATLILPTAPARAQDGLPPGVAVSTVPVAGEDVQHYLRDMDGDGDLDLLRVDEAGLGLRRMDADGHLAAADDHLLEWPGPDLGWCLADIEGDGATDVVLLVAGRSLLVHRVDADGRFDSGVVELVQPEGRLPRGVRQVPCVRDVDGDGRADVVVPGRGVYLIHLRDAEGFAEEPVAVRLEAELEVSTGDRHGVHGRFGQELRVPWFAVRDIDGDGRLDLVSQTAERALFHLARPGLTTEPSWELDLASLKARLDDTRVHLDDLLRSVGERVGWRVADLDGVPPDDLIIQEGASLRVHLGGSEAGPQGPPDRLLKSSGTVLLYTVRDVLGDALPDLQIIRGDVLSIGDAIRMLMVPGALHFDVFTYENQDGLFVRKPSRRTRLTLEVPRLLAFFEELEEAQEELEDRLRYPARRLDLDGDGERDDVADLLDGALRLYRDAVPADLAPTLTDRLRDTTLDGLVEAYILADLDDLEDGGVHVLRLADITELRLTPGSELRAEVSGRVPDLVVPTELGEGAGLGAQLQIGDLDGDGRDDVLLSTREGGEDPIVQLVVLRDG